ncbi:unnamed protein product [Cunninghamella blakesleeana]
MFSNCSVMDLPSYNTNSATTVEQPLFLSNMNTPNIPWLKSKKHHQTTTTTTTNISSRSKQQVQPQRNGPLPALPTTTSTTMANNNTNKKLNYHQRQPPVLLPPTGSLRKRSLSITSNEHQTIISSSSKSSSSSSSSNSSSSFTNATNVTNKPTHYSKLLNHQRQHVLPSNKVNHHSPTSLKSLPSSPFPLSSNHSMKKNSNMNNNKNNKDNKIDRHILQPIGSVFTSSKSSTLPLASPPTPTSPSSSSSSNSSYKKTPKYNYSKNIDQDVNRILAFIDTSMSSSLPSYSIDPQTPISPNSTISTHLPSVISTITPSLSTPMTTSIINPSSSMITSPIHPSSSSSPSSFSSSCSIDYPLLQNNEEQDRMVAQHYILRTAFHDNDYMATSMKPILEQGCIVLDMGCGSGTWTMEMSTAYPSSTFIGIDKLALFPKDIKPKNCHFRKMDLTQPTLPFPDQSVDYIFQRDLNWALLAYQWDDLIKEFLRILKPGGWIELMEMDVESQSSQLIERSLNDKLLHGLSMRQQDPYIARRLPSMLAINGFRRVSSQFQSLPLGWGKSHSNKEDHLTTCSEFARAAGSQYKYLLKSLQPWLVSTIGCSNEKYDSILDQLPFEWSQSHTYIKWHNVIAQKSY